MFVLLSLILVGGGLGCSFEIFVVFFWEKTCITLLLVSFLHSIDFIKLFVTSHDIVSDFLFDGIISPLVF